MVARWLLSGYGGVPAGDLPAIADEIALPAWAITATATLATPHEESVGKNSRPNLIDDCSELTVELSAPVTCIHFVAPPEPGGSLIEPDLSSTIRTSGGNPCVG